MLDNPALNVQFKFSTKISLHLCLPGEAEVGSAEEQPARNNPVTDEVFIIGFGTCQALFYVITSEVDMPQKTYTTYTITTSFFL